MYSLNHSYQEKRNYIRMKIDAPADISVSTGGSALKGVCKDLSGGGMRIDTESILPVGAETEITISSGYAHQPMIRARACVKRAFSKPEADGPKCTLGMEIIEVLN